jgi:HK97 family phage prohead protease
MWIAYSRRSINARGFTVTEPTLHVRPVERIYALDDIHIRQDGDGRVVEAYAAVFSQRSEIRDQDGHYFEENSPSSFNKTIKDKVTRFGVLFNHARTVDGQPNPAATMPIGVPLEVKADSQGVFTATRYLDNPLADHVLDAIKQGALTAQSYSGRLMRSERAGRAPHGSGRSLPVIVRQEIDMREYGPAVFAAYQGAAILGTRMATLLTDLAAMTEDERLHWRQQFEEITTPVSRETEPESSLVTPDGADGTTEVPPEHTSRSQSTTLAAHIRAERIRRGM